MERIKLVIWGESEEQKNVEERGLVTHTSEK